MLEHRPKVLLYHLHVAIVSIVSMWPHVVWMFPKDPPKRRGANDTQWAHHMKHFLSAMGCSWCSATLTAKPSAAQWDRQHQSAAKKNWVIECSSTAVCVIVCHPWCTADAQKWRLGSGGSETHRSTLPGCTWLTIQRPRQGCVLRMMQCYNFTKLYTLIPNKTGGWSILLGGGGWDWIVCRRQDGWWWMRRGCTADGARPQRKQSPRQAASTTLSTLSSQYSQNHWVIECLPALLWFWWVTVTIAVHRVDNIMIP